MPTVPPNPSEILTQPCDGSPSLSGQLNKATKCFPTGLARLLLECTGMPSLECLPWNAFQRSLAWHPLYTGVGVGLPESYLPLSICPKQGWQACWTTQQSWWALARSQPLSSPGVPLNPAWTQHQPWRPVSYRSMSDLLPSPIPHLQLPQTQTL